MSHYKNGHLHMSADDYLTVYRFLNEWIKQAHMQGKEAGIPPMEIHRNLSKVTFLASYAERQYAAMTSRSAA